MVLVDDSIVRGTTTARLVGALRRAGAAEVHLRIGSPPIRHACYLGVDTAEEDSLVAHGRSVDEIRVRVDADSLGYLSLAGLARAVRLPGREMCNACFHGRYPRPVTESTDKPALDVYPPVATLMPTPVAA